MKWHTHLYSPIFFFFFFFVKHPDWFSFAYHLLIDRIDTQEGRIVWANFTISGGKSKNIFSCFLRACVIFPRFSLLILDFFHSVVLFCLTRMLFSSVADVEPLQTNPELEEGYCRALLCRLRFRKVLTPIILLIKNFNFEAVSRNASFCANFCEVLHFT